MCLLFCKCTCVNETARRGWTSTSSTATPGISLSRGNYTQKCFTDYNRALAGSLARPRVELWLAVLFVFQATPNNYLHHSQSTAKAGDAASETDPGAKPGASSLWHVPSKSAGKRRGPGASDVCAYLYTYAFVCADVVVWSCSICLRTTADAMLFCMGA